MVFPQLSKILLNPARVRWTSQNLKGVELGKGSALTLLAYSKKKNALGEKVNVYGLTIFTAPVDFPPCLQQAVTFFQGCNEDHDPFAKDYPPWTAYRSEDYGYTRMTIHNKTHLYMEQVSVDKVSEGRSPWSWWWGGLGELSYIIGTIHKIFYSHKTL